MGRIWNCEHCGKDTRDAERTCDYCEAGMCDFCTHLHDEDELCPSTAPVGTPAASVRDSMIATTQELLDHEKS